MERPAWLNNKTATIVGAIFFPTAVIFAYRVNKYISEGEPMSGGRLYWRQLGWGLLSAIPLFGLIYGISKADDIVATRNRVWDMTNQGQQQPM